MSAENNPVSKRIAFDDDNDIVIIDGVRISSHVLTAITQPSAPGRWFRVAQRTEFDVVVIQARDDGLCAACGRRPHPIDDPQCMPATKDIAEQLAWALYEVQRLRHVVDTDPLHARVRAAVMQARRYMLKSVDSTNDAAAAALVGDLDKLVHDILNLPIRSGAVPPKVSEKDIERWQALIQEKPEGPWEMDGPRGSSYDRIVNRPISDDMLAELAQWLRIGYTPWNGRSMPLSPGDRQFMCLLYFSVQGLIARMRLAEKDAADLRAGVQHHG